MARAPDIAVGQRVYAPHLGIFDGHIRFIDNEVEIVEVRSNADVYLKEIDFDAFDGKWNDENQQWELEA